ncbi:lipoprotein [Kosakonia radicincitans UMEnt01/12]|nr:lipoprotein [Kosakonia radicincitans UMEnt01/12]
MKLTGKPRSFIESGVDSHSSLAARPQKSKNPPKRVLPEKLKLTGKPRSFIESGVDSHSSLAARPQKSKNPPKRVFT